MCQFRHIFGCFAHPLSLFINGRMSHLLYYKKYSVVKIAFEFWAFLQYLSDIFEFLQCFNFVTIFVQPLGLLVGGMSDKVRR